MADLKLSGRIAAASIAVGAFAPDKLNPEQGYKYISADQVLSRAGDALAKAGVSVMPSVVAVEVVAVDRPNKSPRQDARVSFVMFVSDGEETRELMWFGFGSDYSVPDKAVYKAITSGHKYFLMKLLNIGAGNEDGEHETAEPDLPRRRLAPRQDAPAPVTQPPTKTEAAKLRTDIVARYNALSKHAAELGIQHEPAEAFANDKELTDAGRALNIAVKARESELEYQNDQAQKGQAPL